MFLSIFLFLSLIAVAGSAAYFSIIGLAKLFAGASLPVIVMGSSLEFGKIIITSYLYNFWKQTNLLLKSCIILMIITLVGITSLGISGYLISAYQITTVSVQQDKEKLQMLSETLEISRNRLQQINNEIAAVGDNYVTAKQRLMQSFKSELDSLNESIPKLENEILQIKASNIEVNSKVGPIIFITDVFGLSPDKAIVILVFAIVLVFDPLAIVLTIAFNKSIKKEIENKSRTHDSYVHNEHDNLKETALQEFKLTSSS
jgi:hypothetical protein